MVQKYQTVSSMRAGETHFYKLISIPNSSTALIIVDALVKNI